LNLSFSPKALQDFEAIGEYIALDSAWHAVRFVRQLRDICSRLVDFPEAFPLIANFESSGVRRRVHRNYLIFYRVEPDGIEILRILHSAMDYERLLFPE
jgi:toxin ParE1/3/4